MKHILDSQGNELVVKPDPQKLERLRTFPRLNDSKDIQSLIGVIKTFERWNFSLSGKCEKIRELGKKDIKFLWTPHHKAEFIALKQEILGNRSVIPFDLGKKIKIYTDAAKTGGFGYALNEEGYNRLVSC